MHFWIIQQNCIYFKTRPKKNLTAWVIIVLTPKHLEVLHNEYQIFNPGTRWLSSPGNLISSPAGLFCSAARCPGFCGAESDPHLLFANRKKQKQLLPTSKDSDTIGYSVKLCRKLGRNWNNKCCLDFKEPSGLAGSLNGATKTFTMCVGASSHWLQTLNPAPMHLHQVLYLVTFTMVIEVWACVSLHDPTHPY